MENQQHPYHILIVDDDRDLGLLMSDFIKNRHEVIYVVNGAKALDYLNEHTVDLILLDLDLPDMTGFDLLTRLRQEYSAKELPIIILSASEDVDSIVRGFELGANDYIVKPVQLAVMMARITTHLNLIGLQNERQNYIHDLERSDRIRQQLNRIASHDLKNPLNNLRMAEGLLREELGDNPNIHPLLNSMAASLDMMEQVVEGFLDVMAIQTQSLNLKHDPVRIIDVINNAYTQYELVASAKNINLLMGETSGTVLADPARMAQIVGNLVSNAIKYSPTNADVLTWSEINGGILRLNVRDHGAGVPEEERHLLFAEFSKLSTRPTAGEGSTGLGLWIVKHLIELQGGDAGATFPDDGGSIFWIEMPIAEKYDY
ncbi:MAG: hybrid sensor histidine kinase/response regulator [Anaerolineae bacterium]